MKGSIGHDNSLQTVWEPEAPDASLHGGIAEAPEGIVHKVTNTSLRDANAHSEFAEVAHS